MERVASATSVAVRGTRILLALAFIGIGVVALWWLGFDMVAASGPFRSDLTSSPGGPVGVGVILGTSALASFSAAAFAWPKRRS
jgi:hypothetical protein